MNETQNRKLNVPDEYIFNLQDENKRLQEQNDELYKRLSDLRGYREESRKTTIEKWIGIYAASCLGITLFYASHLRENTPFLDALFDYLLDFGLGLIVYFFALVISSGLSLFFNPDKDTPVIEDKMWIVVFFAVPILCFMLTFVRHAS